jgi:hypothetical protein
MYSKNSTRTPSTKSKLGFEQMQRSQCRIYKKGAKELKVLRNWRDHPSRQKKAAKETQHLHDDRGSY